MKSTDRSSDYIATFPNTPEGLQMYANVRAALREFFSGGRFVKMFRGGTRHYSYYTSVMTGKRVRTGGSCSLNDGDRFDVYFATNGSSYSSSRNAKFIGKKH